VATASTLALNDVLDQGSQTGAFSKVDRQMRALVYVWRQFVHEGSVAVSAVASLEEQLVALYQEREEAGGLSFDALRITIQGLDEQLRSLYDEQQSDNGDRDRLRETAKNLEEQLVALYREREQENYVAGHHGKLGALVETLQSFEEQLAELYKEREGSRYGTAAANQMVDSLEEQVAALLDERNALVEELAICQDGLSKQRAKAKEMLSAMVDRALC